jgi:hypothetical protein
MQLNPDTEYNEIREVYNYVYGKTYNIRKILGINPPIRYPDVKPDNDKKIELKNIMFKFLMDVFSSKLKECPSSKLYKDLEKWLENHTQESKEAITNTSSQDFLQKIRLVF